MLASRLWRAQQPTTPLEEATHWVELLAEHKTLSHLKIVDLPLFQYFCLDVFLVAGSGLILVAYLLMALMAGRRKGKQVLKVKVKTK